MLSDKMQAELNAQLNYELFSAYIYAAMAAYFEDKSLLGFAHWMRVQCNEEVEHAIKFYNYINQANGRVILEAIGKPPEDFDSPLKAFEEAYEHEQLVTKKIYGIVDLAQKENDHATHNFLQWFIAEQVEEEATANEIVQQLRFVENEPSGLFMLDRELGKRQSDDDSGGAESGQ